MIWPYFKSSDILIFDIYGTYDGRKVELGTPYSYDKKSDGSMKATWKRTVTKIGQDPTYDTFNSVYQPPALFHKEETFVPSTPAAGTNPAVDPIPIITSPPPSTTINPENENQPLEPEQN